MPQGWIETRLGEIATFNPKHPTESDRDQTVSFVPMSAVDEHLGAIVDAADRKLREIWTGYTHFAEGDVIFAKITPCMENGKAAVATGLTNGLACGSTEFYVLRPEGVEPGLLWRFLRQRSFRTEAEKHMSGAVGQRRVPRQFLEDHPFPLPPPAEQRRIVAKLDALTARLARARAELDRVPVLADHLRRASLSRATEPASDGSAMPLGTMLTQVRTGPFGSAVHKSDYVRSGTPLINPMHIVRGKILPSPDVTVDNSKAEVLEAFRLMPGDVIIGRRGEMGRCAVVTTAEEGYLIGTGSMALSPAPSLHSDYLQVFLSSPTVVAALERAAVGSTMVNLNQKILLGLPIFVPELAEQQRRLAILKRGFARADRLEAEAARARALLDRLEAALLARAFRGELVPQDPADEPATVLLARIRAQREAAPKAKRGRRAKASNLEKSGA